MKRQLDGAHATEAAGAALARAVRGQGGLITLAGELGAGKTTLVRGLLRGLGHVGAVRSPTYTLLEPYELADTVVWHLDLYRVAAADELDAIGLREAFDGSVLMLVEWPERAGAALPVADLRLTLAYDGDGRSLAAAAGTERGRVWQQALESQA